MAAELDRETELRAEQKSDDEEIALSEIIDVLRQRSDTYTLLSCLYRQEIDKEQLEELHDRLYPAENVNDNLYTGYLYIATYLSNLWSGSVHELSIDFSRCFFGHGVDAYSAAYPYESVYTSAKRLTMQAARDEVLAIYRAYGIDKTSSWKEGEDHLALELEFIRILCDRTVLAFMDGKYERALKLLSAQFGFMQEHLVSWVPMLVADMKMFAQTKMYLGLAYLTEGFLLTDYNFLKSLLSSLEDTEEISAIDVQCQGTNG